MAGKKVVRECFGPQGLIKKLEKCSWRNWLKMGRSFDGFEFDGHCLYEGNFPEKIKCRITVMDIKAKREFSIEGLCDPDLISGFFNKHFWKPMKLANYYVNQDPIGGRDPNYYKVFLEVL